MNRVLRLKVQGPVWLVYATFALMGCLVALAGSLPVQKQAAFFVTPPIGGGGGGSCPADGSPTILQSGTTDLFDVNSDAPYIGMIYTNGPAATNVCKVQCKITAQANTVGATLTVRIYALSGTTLSTLLGETTGIAGDNSWSLTDVVFSFSSDVALAASTRYATVLTGNGGAGTGQYAKLEQGAATINGTVEAWHSDGTTFGLAGGGNAPSFGLYMH